MKIIELNKTTEVVTIVGRGKAEMDIDTAGLIRTACNYSAKNGFSMSDISNRLRILNALEDAETKGCKDLCLEDSDYRNLSALVNECKWNVVSKTILSFGESFKN